MKLCAPMLISDNCQHLRDFWHPPKDAPMRRKRARSPGQNEGRVTTKRSRVVSDCDSDSDEEIPDAPGLRAGNSGRFQARAAPLPSKTTPAAAPRVPKPQPTPAVTRAIPSPVSVAPASHKASQGSKRECSLHRSRCSHLLTEYGSSSLVSPLFACQRLSSV